MSITWTQRGECGNFSSCCRGVTLRWFPQLLCTSGTQQSVRRIYGTSQTFVYTVSLFPVPLPLFSRSFLSSTLFSFIHSCLFLAPFFLYTFIYFIYLLFSLCHFFLVLYSCQVNFKLFFALLLLFIPHCQFSSIPPLCPIFSVPSSCLVVSFLPVSLSYNTIWVLLAVSFLVRHSINPFTTEW